MYIAKIKTMKHAEFDHQQRIFSKMLLELTDYIQYYCQQTEQIAQDCIKLQPDSFDNPVLFRRQFRWLALGFSYDPLDSFFDVHQKLFDSFIDSVSEDSGVDIRGFETNRYRRAKDERPDVDRALQEVVFVCQAMEKVYDVALSWAKTLEVECFMTLDPHALMRQIRPLAAVQLSVSVLFARYEELREQQVSAADPDPLLENCEQILGAVRYIRESKEYAGWQKRTDAIEAQILELYPKLRMLQMVRSPAMTSFHFTKMS